MSLSPIEVIIEGGKIEPVDPHQLPASGRGWLTISPPEETSDKPELVIKTNENGLSVVRATGRVITFEMVKRIDELTW